MSQLDRVVCAVTFELCALLCADLIDRALYLDRNPALSKTCAVNGTTTTSITFSNASSGSIQNKCHATFELREGGRGEGSEDFPKTATFGDI